MAEPFLRIPPFPSSRAAPLAVAGATAIGDADAQALTHLLREAQVGGNYWGTQCDLPEGRDLLLAPASRRQALEMLDIARSEDLLDRCALLSPGGLGNLGELPTVDDRSDPWHLAGSAGQIWAGADQELAFVGALAGRTVRIFGDGRFGSVSNEDGLVRALQHEIGAWSYHCPFTGETIAPNRAMEMLAGWRTLIDQNRQLSGIFGIAGWKRPTVGPLLWDGSGGPRYAANISRLARNGSTVAAWKSRTPPRTLAELEAAGLPLAEIEDGLIRGRGLGANCVPPLSIVVDHSGIYFDPSQPSDLEQILQTVEMDEQLLDRAARLREMILEAGISKYGAGGFANLRSGKGRKILVVGQVEDDRSIQSGGGGQTNLELLQRARSIESDAWLIYRPHPDVEAGHRTGHIPDAQVLTIANEIERGGSISALIDAVDEIHCITSQAGFEGLLRGKRVTTHGVPFYAGWGLTNDLAPIPSRRTRRRSLDELVAAAFILYPRYVDPMTRLPCPPEVLVNRIARGEDMVTAPLAGIRSLQGRLRVAFRSLREAVA